MYKKSRSVFGLYKQYGGPAESKAEWNAIACYGNLGASGYQSLSWHYLYVVAILDIYNNKLINN